MPISVVFDPPLPSDSPSTFNTKAFTLLGDLNDWSTQANALPGEVATNLTTLLAAPPAIGSTTPAAGSFTTLSASDGLTITKNGPTARALTIKNDSLNINEYAEIHFQNSGSDVIQSSIRSVRDTSGSFGTSLQFLTENDFTSGEAVRMTLSGSGAVTIPGSLSLTGGTFGYGTGAGGTVTQATSKSTAVTLNKPCGQITMNNSALAAGASVSFQLSNSLAGVNDSIVANIVWDGVANPINYSVRAASYNTAGGTILFVVKNETAGSLSEALSINFAIIKGATS